MSTQTQQTATTTLPARQAQASVATNKRTIKDQLEGDAFKRAVATVLPKHLTPDRFIRVAIMAMTRTPKLAQCEPASFFSCLMQLSQYGLEPDGRRAHLIPFENRKRGVVECQLIIDYKGLAELVMRSGIVSNLHADVVCENDTFDYDRGELAHHKINFREPRGKVYAVYALCRFKDGSEKCDVMTRDEVEAVRGRSRAGNNGPWVTDWNEMAKKGLALDTPIPTPDGWTTMGQINPGDIVFDVGGQQTQVLGVSETKQLPCFRVTFSNGDSIVCDNEHRWVATVNNRRGVYDVSALHDLKARGAIISVPVAGEIECDWTDLPIEPWSLGYWLGNGRKNDGNVTCHSDDAQEIEDRLESDGFNLGAMRQDGRSLATSIGIKGMRVALRDLGVLGGKHIPPLYLRATREQRRKLLQGLMDSDGHISKDRGRAIFASTDEQLARQVLELVLSLGQLPTLQSRICNGYGKTVLCHRVEWQPSFNPCTTARKSSNFRERALSLYRGVKRVEKVESVPTRCIAVDSPTHTYLAGLNFVPTHNTVFRRLSKWLPLSPEIRDAVESEAEVIENQRLDSAKPVFDAPKPMFELTQPEAEPTDNGEDLAAVQAIYRGADTDDPSTSPSGEAAKTDKPTSHEAVAQMLANAKGHQNLPKAVRGLCKLADIKETELLDWLHQTGKLDEGINIDEAAMVAEPTIRAVHDGWQKVAEEIKIHRAKEAK